MTAGRIAICLKFVSIARSGGDLIEEALGVPVEIAQSFGLQAIGNDAIEQMARQMVGRLAAKDRMPLGPQTMEIEIAQMRDLILQFARRRGHDDQAARRVDFVATCRGASGDTIR
jgi:hypothetical protein